MADMEMVRQPTQVKWILFCFSDRNLFWTVSHIGVPGGAARRSGGGLSRRTRPTGNCYWLLVFLLLIVTSGKNTKTQPPIIRRRSQAQIRLPRREPTRSRRTKPTHSTEELCCMVVNLWLFRQLQSFPTISSLCDNTFHVWSFSFTKVVNRLWISLPVISQVEVLAICVEVDFLKSCYTFIVFC